jgi:hypothetical protein
MRCNNKNVPTLILYHHKLFQIFPHCLAIFLPRKTDFGICVIRCVGRRRDLFGQAGRPVLPLGPCARIKADGPDRDGPSAAVFSVGKLRRASVGVVGVERIRRASPSSPPRRSPPKRRPVAGAERCRRLKPPAESTTRAAVR